MATSGILVFALELMLTCTYRMAESIPVQKHDTTTLTATTTGMPGCYYMNTYYPPGSVVENGYDASSNWCYGANCDISGMIVYWDDFHCRTTTTTPPPTTTPSTTTPPTTLPPTTIPLGCLYNGQYFQPGVTIAKGYDSVSNWCYSTFCGMDGQVVHADNFNCKTTIPPTSTSNNPGQVVG